MQFLVLGFDGTDEGAAARRQAARPKHIALGTELLAKGNFWYGAALTDDRGAMVGSMLLMDFPSRTELQAWLDVEPYVTDSVWQSFEVRTCSVRDPWMFNRPQEFFEIRT